MCFLSESITYRQLGPPSEEAWLASVAASSLAANQAFEPPYLHGVGEMEEGEEEKGLEEGVGVSVWAGWSLQRGRS